MFFSKWIVRFLTREDLNKNLKLKNPRTLVKKIMSYKKKCAFLWKSVVLDWGSDSLSTR